MGDHDRWSGHADLAGKTMLVTGPTQGGLGYYTALELARRGARVVLAGRTQARLDEAVAAITGDVPAAELETLILDLSDLDAVRSAAGRAEAFGPLDVLVNNAGIMATSYARTRDGLESQLATNHFGPFLLTGLLLPQLVASGDARVVTVSSLFHRFARSAPLGDPRDKPRPYLRWQQYGRTKLANLLFTYELARRATAAGLPLRALAAHPGYAGTSLLSNGPFGRLTSATSIVDAANRLISQPAATGALPSLMAATADLPSGTFCGPDGPRQLHGAPRVVTSSALSHDTDAQRALWALSERVVDLSWP